MRLYESRLKSVMKAPECESERTRGTFSVSPLLQQMLSTALLNLMFANKSGRWRDSEKEEEEEE